MFMITIVELRLSTYSVLNINQYNNRNNTTLTLYTKRIECIFMYPTHTVYTINNQ